MSGPDDKNLGSVLTVIRGRPVSFAVYRLDKRFDPADPLERTPYWYTFVREGESTRFTVKVSSNLASGVFQWNTLRLDNEAIRYGLRRVRSEVDKGEFMFSSDEWETILKEPKREGKALRDEILLFFHDVNMLLPAQDIGVLDVADNFYNDEGELAPWIQNLQEAELLVSGHPREYRERRDGLATPGYRLNPKKYNEVAKELADAVLRGVGSTRTFVDGARAADRYKHYKIIDIEPDQFKNGFVFHMTEFDGELETLFREHIQPFCKEKLGLEVVISKDDNSPNSLTDMIISHIHKCKFAIANITTKNPNVMYELGFAHAINKDVIIICEAKRKHRIFDVRDINMIYYKDVKHLKQELDKKIASVLKRP